MKNKNTFKKISIASMILLIFFSSIPFSFAADYTNQEKIPGSEVTSDFIQYLKDIINFGFAIVGILALFMLIIGAYQYLIAVGSGKADGAKETISSALLGLILGLCAWIILNTINPDLVNMRAITKITSSSTTASKTAATAKTYDTANAGTVPTSKKERIEKYDSYVKAAAQKYGVPENAIRAVIDKESGWDPTAVGKENPNDKGMMQINQTSHPKFFASNDWQDPSANINYGTSLLAEGYKYTGSWEGAAGYFHRGPTNWNDSRGQTYSADFAIKQQQYVNSGY